MIKLLYTLLIHAYKASFFLVAFFNDKAKRRVKGIQESKTKEFKFGNSQEKTVLVHCASQGEHEQALPIIRWILLHTEYNILVSFFSPSGYENFNCSDFPRLSKVYLPFDTPKDVSNFILKYNPKIAIIIKNEWWWNLLLKLKLYEIPTYLVSATFRKEHYFIKYRNHLFTKGLQVFSAIFVIDKESESHISNIITSRIKIAGDTRIDQVVYNKERALSSKSKPNNTFNGTQTKTIVYGSVWESDLSTIDRIIALFPKAQHLIYPHNLNTKNITLFSERLDNCKLVTNTSKASKGTSIITSMGELKLAYDLAYVAYVGGGFGVGIHNILEASVFNIPVIFGPNYQKSNEAINLIKYQCAYSFSKVSDLDEIFESVTEQKNRKEIESKLKSYFSPKYTPTEIICQEIFMKNNIHV